MAVNYSSSGRNGLVDFEVQKDFARVDTRTNYFLVLQAHETDVLGGKVTLTEHRRGTENVIATDSIRNISTISVHVLSGPQLSAHVYDFTLNRLSFFRFEKATRRSRRGVLTVSLWHALDESLTNDFGDKFLVYLRHGY